MPLAKANQLFKFSMFIIISLNFLSQEGVAKPIVKDKAVLLKKSNCIVSGAIEKIVDVKVNGKPTVPINTKIVRIKVKEIKECESLKKIKNGLLTGSYGGELDVIFPVGLQDTAQECEIPTASNSIHDFFLIFDGFFTPVSCNQWLDLN